MTKREMASKMLTKKERKNHVPVFLSEAWEARKEDIKNRVIKKILKDKERKAKEKIEKEMQEINNNLQVKILQ